MRTIVIGVASSLLGLLAGCAPSRVHDLSTPAIAVVVTEGGGFCQSLHAVDGDRRVWTSRSCGDARPDFTGVDRVVSPEEWSELYGMLDAVVALPPDDADCAVPSPSGRRYEFLRTDDGEDEHWPRTRQCDPGVPLIALDLAARLEALAAPPGAPPDAG